MSKLIPLVFLAVGLAAGVGGGLMLAPEKVESGDVEGSKAEAGPEAKEPEKTDKDKASEAQEYFKLTKQFVVPIVSDDEIEALVTMSLSLETSPGVSEAIYAIEPKLRDGFLQVLFDHANTGGFDGAFTQSDNLKTLRKSLLDVAKKDLGDDVSGVLILSVARQDT